MRLSDPGILASWRSWKKASIVSLLVALNASSVYSETYKVTLPKFKALPPLDRDSRFVFSPLLENGDLWSRNPVGYVNLYQGTPTRVFGYRFFIPEASGKTFAPPGFTYFSSEEVTLDLASGFAKRLKEILRSLFPTIYEALEFDKSAVDYIVSADMSYRWQLSHNGAIDSIKVFVSLSIADSDGKIIDTIEGQGTGVPHNHRPWSRITTWQDASGEALTTALGKTIEGIYTSKFMELQALPPGLKVSARFDDSRSFFPNGKLDAGESAHLVAQIVNSGPGPAFGVILRATADHADVILNGQEEIGRVAPGESREVTLPVSGSLNLATASTHIRIAATESRGYGSQPVDFEAATGALLSPHLEIVDVRLTGLADSAIAGGESLPRNGEVVVTKVRFRNSGPGDAVNVVVSGTSSNSEVRWTSPSSTILRVPPHQVQEVLLQLELPISYSSRELPLVFKAADGRGDGVGKTSWEQSWKVEIRRPAVDIHSYRLYDGNSANSRGNRDGRINNGERVEVALAVKNSAGILARGVQIGLEAVS